MASQVLIDAAGHLRDLRRSGGYDTAASFARAIGYSVAKYQQHERIYPSSLTTGGDLFYAIERVGPLTSDWLLFHRPEWAGPLHARAALRVRNGVSPEKADRLFRQEFIAAMWKRQAQEG